MIRRLRLKFICVNMLIVSCMLALLFGMLFHFTRQSLIQERVSMMQRAAQEPFGPRAPKRGGTAPELPVFTLETGPDGALHAAGGSWFDLSDEDALEELLEEVLDGEAPSGILEDWGLRYYRTQTPHGEKVVFTDAAGERAALRSLIRVCIAVGAGSFVLFLGISLLLSKWAVRPVEEAWRQQKQFVADASHELKTPLTVIMANAELLTQEEYDAEQKARFSRSILSMSQRMRRLVEQLLELARLDSAQDVPPMEPLDLSALTEDCLLPFEPVFYEAGLPLEAEIEKGLIVRGDGQSLRQVVDILLDNAQKYAEPGTVRLQLKKQGHHAVLTLSNPAAELSKAGQKAIFKRFTRGDSARGSTGSYGLGLPIAESLVSRCGGRIGCGWEAGEIRFRVSLPLAAGGETDS